PCSQRGPVSRQVAELASGRAVLIYSDSMAGILATVIGVALLTRPGNQPPGGKGTDENSKQYHTASVRFLEVLYTFQCDTRTGASRLLASNAAPLDFAAPPGAAAGPPGRYTGGITVELAPPPFRSRQVSIGDL